MKQLLSIGLLASAAQVVHAQEAPVGRHQVSAGIVGLAPKVGVQYHYILNQRFTLGGEYRYSLIRERNVNQLGLLGRAFLAGHAPTGLYAQAKLNAAILERYNVPNTRSTNSYSAMLGLGYQLRLGSRWLAQAGVDVRVYPYSLVVYGNEAPWWQAGQDGALFDGQLTVGYVF